MGTTLPRSGPACPALPWSGTGRRGACRAQALPWGPALPSWTQVGIKIAGRNINNLRYADDTTLMAESEELQSLLMQVKEDEVFLGGAAGNPRVPRLLPGTLGNFPVRSQEYCGVGRGLSGLHWVWCNG